jgi:hypothetical protein
MTRSCALRSLFQATLISTAVLAAACGGDKPPPKAPTPPPEQAEQHDGQQAQVSAEIGALDEDAVTRTFASSLKGLQRCLDDGAGKVQYLGGSVSFSIKVDQRGQLSDARLDHSTLGDYDTEKCMLDVLRSKQWPKPVGGVHGLASKSFEFDPPNDVRPPTEWTSDRIDKTLDELGSKISSCKGGASGSFSATMYVGTDGHALSVGVTPPDSHGEAAVDCLVGVLKEAKYPSPGSWPAKVTFTL